MDALKFPLQFTGGSLAVLSDETDEYYAQLIATTMQIAPGELILQPEYGVASPEFDTVAMASFAQTVAQFLPEVDIVETLIKPGDDGIVRLVVQFERR